MFRNVDKIYVIKVCFIPIDAHDLSCRHSHNVRAVSTAMSSAPDLKPLFHSRIRTCKVHARRTVILLIEAIGIFPFGMPVLDSDVSIPLRIVLRTEFKIKLLAELTQSASSGVDHFAR